MAVRDRRPREGGWLTGPRLAFGGGVTCPGCGEGGEFYEPRGQSICGGEVIARCKACLAGMRIGTGLLGRRRAPRLIDPDAWMRMDLAWELANPLPTTGQDPIDDPRALINALIEAGIHGEILAHLVAEALTTSLDHAETLIAGPAAREERG